VVKRNIWSRCKKYLERKEILLIIGARQTGKTTLLRAIASHLEQEGGKAFFLTLESPLLLAALNENPENIFKYIPRSEQQKYLLLDEVQYLQNPSKFLKYIYDIYSDTIKLVVSGSSAFYIDRSFKDSLAGRKRIIELFPFSRNRGVSPSKNAIFLYRNGKNSEHTCKNILYMVAIQEW